MIIGLVSSVFSGVLNGSFALPMKKITNWEWENTWFVYALVAMLFLPIITAFISVPGLVDIYKQVDSSILLKTQFTGILFGVGSVTFGLGLHYAGLSLGNSIMVGIISVTGSLVPMIMLSPESIFTIGGGILLLAMLVSVIGVVYLSIAGKLRDGSKGVTTDSKEKKVSFKVALFICIISGIFSSMLNISLVIGLPIAELAQANLSDSVSSYRAYNAVWAITLSGTFVSYFLYSVFLFIKNRSLVRYKNNAPNFFRAVLMGVLWFSCISLYGAGVSNLGKLGTTIGWLILMSFTVIVGNLWGVVTGEWKDAPQKAKRKMITGLLLLSVSVVFVAVAKFYL